MQLFMPERFACTGSARRRSKLLTNFFENSESKSRFSFAGCEREISPDRRPAGKKSSCGRGETNLQTTDFRLSGQTGQKPRSRRIYKGNSANKIGRQRRFRFTHQEQPETIAWHRNVVSNLNAKWIQVIEINENEKVLSLLPLFSAYLQIVNLWLRKPKAARFLLKEPTPDSSFQKR